MQLEEINPSDPNSVWEYINRLGPKSKKPIPMECYATDGSIIYEENAVLNKWREELFNLYNPKEADGNESHKKFKDFIIKDNDDFEKLDCDDDVAIYSCFTPNEVGKVISKSKANKAPGIDGIVYDVLKNENSISLLTNLFNICFESHKVPDVWLQSLIHPTPKSHQNDPRIPLNYRGISLLSVISKLYTSALNVRLNRYSEDSECVVNKQNGFREGWCCLDHIFTLHNLLKIRKENNDQTFCAFIDLKETSGYTNLEKLDYLVNFIMQSKLFTKPQKAAFRSITWPLNGLMWQMESAEAILSLLHYFLSFLFSIYLNDLATEIKISMWRFLSLICVYLCSYMRMI